MTAQRALLACVGAVLVAFLALPILALFATTSLEDARLGLEHPLVWPALRLSVLTTLATLAIVVALGTPLAWTLAGWRSPLARAIETALQLPIVIPPAVAGVALLLAFGRRGLLSGVLYPT